MLIVDSMNDFFPAKFREAQAALISFHKLQMFSLPERIPEIILG